MNVKIPPLFKYKSQYNCTDIDAGHFGEHVIFIYRVEENNILRRWTMTPGGKRIDPIVFNKTEYVCFVLIHINQQGIQPIKDVQINEMQITIIMQNGNNTVTKYVKDEPRCYTVE